MRGSTVRERVAFDWGMGVSMVRMFDSNVRYCNA
jgi:hypothetical protein